MIHLPRKAKEHIFLIFILGGIFGILDGRNDSISQFIGNGIAMIIIALAIGTIISFFTSTEETTNEQEQEEEANVLDADFTSDKKSRTKPKTPASLQKYKYGIYVALFFIITEILSQLTYLF